MNEPPPEESIPIHVDTSDLDLLTQKLVDADAAVQQLRDQVVQLFNSISGQKLDSFAKMQYTLQHYGGVAGTAGIDTKLDAALASLSARITQVAAAAQTPPPTPAPAQPPAPQPPPSAPPAPPGSPTPTQPQPATGAPPPPPSQPAPASVSPPHAPSPPPPAPPQAVPGAPQVAAPTGPLSAAPTGAAPAQQTQLNTLFIQWLQLQIAATQKQQAQPPPPGTPGGAPGVPTPAWMSGMSASQAYPGGNWNQTMANTALQASILTTILPYATGGQAPAGTSGSQATQPPPPAPAPAPTGRSGGGGGGLSAMGAGWLASSLAIATAPNVEAGMVGAVTGQLAGALAKVALVAPPWATALMGIAAGVGAAGLGSNALAASAASREQMLLANVGGAATGVSETGAGLGGAVGASPTPLPGMPQAPGQGSLLQQIYKAGVDYYVPPSQSVQTATQLGESGMRQQDIVSNLRNTLAFSAITGESLQSSAALTSTLAMQGGQTPTQISKVFQDMWLSAEKAGIPMNKMVDSIQTLEQVTNGAARSVYDIAGAMAVQKIVGPNVNTGGLFQSAQTAIGFDAIAQAGMLGISPEKFASIQGNQAALFDTVSTRLQDLFGGGKPITNPSQGTIDLAAGVAQSELGVNLAQYSPIIATGITRLFLDNKPAQAEALARQNAALTGPTSFTDQGKAVADATTSQATKDLVQAETLLAQNANSLATAFTNLQKTITNPPLFIPNSAEPKNIPGTDIPSNIPIDPNSPLGQAESWLNGIYRQLSGTNVPGMPGKDQSGLPKPGSPLGWLGQTITNAGNWLEQQWTIPFSSMGVAGAHAAGLPSRLPTPTTDAGWDAAVASGINFTGLTPAEGTAYRNAQLRLGLSTNAAAKERLSVAGNPLSRETAALYYQAAYQYGINPLLLMGQGSYESGFNPSATGPNVPGQGHAMGIGQFMPSNIQDMMKRKGSPLYGDVGYNTNPSDQGIYPGTFNPYNPQQAIQLQAYEMSQLIAAYKGNVTTALDAYNAGPGDLAAGAGYASVVEGEAQRVALEVTVHGDTIVRDLTNAMIGIGTFTPQKHTIDLERTPKGAPAKAIPPPKKKRL